MLRLGQFVRFVHEDFGVGFVTFVEREKVEVQFLGGAVTIWGHPKSFKVIT
jgi:hypothetical protein